MVEFERSEVFLQTLRSFREECDKVKYFVRARTSFLIGHYGIIEGPSFFDGQYLVVPWGRLKKKDTAPIHRGETGTVTDVGVKNDLVTYIRVVWRDLISVYHSSQPPISLTEKPVVSSLDDLFIFVQVKPKKEE